MLTEPRIALVAAMVVDNVALVDVNLAETDEICVDKVLVVADIEVSVYDLALARVDCAAT